MELTKKTIGQYLKERAAGIGDHTAMEMFGWSCSFAQLDETSDLMAGRLDDMGVTGEPMWESGVSTVRTGYLPSLRW